MNDDVILGPDGWCDLVPDGLMMWYVLGPGINEWMDDCDVIWFGARWMDDGDMF
jgi:hypothetical protein